MLAGEIGRFLQVRLKGEELLAHEFPLAIANGGISSIVVVHHHGAPDACSTVEVRSSREAMESLVESLVGFAWQGWHRWPRPMA